jgi:agmatine/peptidylarginine deiminase
MTSPRARPLSTPSDYGALMLKTPAEAGYRMPAEWERHACCWMSWPSRADQWVDGLAGAQDTYAAVARAIRRFEPVRMVAEPHCADVARAQCGADVDIDRLHAGPDSRGRGFEYRGRLHLDSIGG